MPLHRLSPKVAALPILSLLSAFATCCIAQSEPAQTSRQPYLYRWSFEAGGLPESEFPEGVSGGALTVSGGEPGHVPLFQSKGGVGGTNPGVLNLSHCIYGNASGAQANSYGSPLRTGKPLNRFTITMWIKPEIPVAKQPQACLLNISPADNESGPQSIQVSLESDGFNFRVNGSPSGKLDASESVVKPNEWVFLVFCYDGLAENVYYVGDMINAIGSKTNAAILAGDLSHPMRIIIGKYAITTGGPTYSITSGKIAIDGMLAAIGSSNSRYDRSFVGWIGDVRLYDSILSLTEMEQVRHEAVGK